MLSWLLSVIVTVPPAGADSAAGANFRLFAVRNSDCEPPDGGGGRGVDGGRGGCVAVGGTGVSVGGKGVSVGGTGVSVGATVGVADEVGLGARTSGVDVAVGLPSGSDLKPTPGRVAEAAGAAPDVAVAVGAEFESPPQADSKTTDAIHASAASRRNPRILQM
jgi:hypothetical protein